MPKWEYLIITGVLTAMPPVVSRDLLGHWIPEMLPNECLGS